MKNKEAQALIGTRVQVWTAMNGVYVATLEAVFGSPWRASAKITGILEPASHLQHGKVCRRGFRVGEQIEVGGSSIKPTEAEGSLSYLEVLEAASAQHRSVHVAASNPHGWVHEAFAKAMEAVVIAEKQRLATGVWSLKS